MTIQQICVHQCRNPTGSRLRIHVCPAGHTCLRPPEAQLWAPSSAVNTSLFLLSSGLKNHREHRGHREKQQISMLSVSSGIDYPCNTSINVNAIARDLNSLNIYSKVNKNDNYGARKNRCQMPVRK